MTLHDPLRFLCPAETLADDQLTEIELDAPGLSLITTRRNGLPRAWLNVCPHQGRALNFAPNRFLRDAEGRLVCAAHGAVFDLADGGCVSGPCKGASLTELPLVEQNGGIYLDQHTKILPAGR